ncbi:hypothetical protein QQS21_006164 [Conoideocrella luteorostrata]|uniref:Polyketide synthase n=1 Tax=Conoideocrella luteorostrata TaxID=1105319 RepID=A0AAJ0CN42_9HYPO|nr:hypothetical protein QQS21_006164 [Conoideocrella luteorostrata]
MQPSVLLNAAEHDTSRTSLYTNNLSGHVMQGLETPDCHSVHNGSTNGSTNGTSEERNRFNGDEIYHNGIYHKPEKTNSDPIVICGMACRLPGGIGSPEELWKYLMDKQDARSQVPGSRYNTTSFSSSVGKPGTTNTDYGYFLSHDLRSFDASRFHMSVKEVERCDPQQRLMLQVSQECIDDAGETTTAGRRVGVYVGDMQRGWADAYGKETQNYGTYHLLGLDDFALSNRVSYELNLKGPSVTVRAACASSLCALSDACKAISSGECESAIVGGASIILGPDTTIQVGEQGALSPDGSCKSFSAKANGYARAEAVSAIYIKPLSAAFRDGNPVRAVIRAAASNHNGRNGSITAPNITAQQDLIRRTYELAEITSFSDTPFVECHGTGTPVGDRAEAEAVGSILGGHGVKVYIGSVKPNLGHSEGASGLTSLIKAVLALEHKTVPPNIKFDTPNPDIQFEKYNLTVPTEPVPWPTGRQERVSVNNFGIGGVNAHVIIDSAKSFHVHQELESAGDHPQLLVYSAATRASVEMMGIELTKYVARNPDRIEDVAFTLANRREHLPHRAFLVASREKPGTPVVSSEPKTKPGDEPKIIMVFTGQGAQWPQMGRDLIKSSKAFKASIKSMDSYLQKHFPDRSKWSIEGELRKSAKSSRVAVAEFSQPLCIAIQVALVDTLREAGIKPAATVGHSSGEIAGAYAGGALSREEAIIAAYHRGAVAASQTKPGAMAAIGLGRKDVEEFLVPGVCIACENSPRSVTISGDAEEVVQVVESISKANPDALARQLKVNKAYHSYHMAEVSSTYFDLVGPQMTGKSSKIPFFSSVKGRLLGSEEVLGPAYWQQNLESPVLFKDAVCKMAEHSISKNAIFLEIGPHSALSGPLRQTLTEMGDGASQMPYVAAMLRGQSSTESLLAAIGKLYVLRASVNFKALYPQGHTLPNLPAYPWDNSKVYWHETRVMREWRERRFKHHDLLGLRTLESTDQQPIWRNMFHLDSVPWIRDHGINDDIVYPFAAYIAMAGEAIRQVTGVEQGFRLRQATATTALVVSEDRPVEIITSFRQADFNADWWDFTIASHNGHSWVQHFTGEATALDKPLGPAKSVPELTRKVNATGWYKAISRTGFDFGPTFRCIENLKCATMQPAKATASIRNTSFIKEDSSYHIHPTAIDNVFQLQPVASLLGQSWKLGLNIITSIQDLSILRCSANFDAYGEAILAGNGSIVGSGEGSWNGETIMRVSNTSINILQQMETADTHAAAQQVWGPHIDFTDISQLLDHSTHCQDIDATALIEVTDIAILYTHQIISDCETNSGHMDKYRSWIHKQVSKNPHQGYEASGPVLSRDGLLEDMKTKVHSLAGSSVADIANTVAIVAASMEDLVKAECDPFHVLGTGGMLAKMAAYMNEFEQSRFLQTFAHTKPDLRILQLGSKTISETNTVLQALQGRYSRYTIVDSSRDLISAVKDQFQDQPNMEFAVLDIDKDMDAAGFVNNGIDRQYHLIIATNSLGQAHDIHRGLKNIWSILHPSGRLLMQERAASVTSRWIDFIMGIFPTWPSSFLYDDRPEAQTLLDSSRWKAALDESGFQILDSITPAHSSPLHLNDVILARPRVSGNSRPITKKVAILTADAKLDNNVAANDMNSQLSSRGYEVSFITLNNKPPIDQDIIALLDYSAPFLADMSQETYELLNQFVANLGNSGLFWVTGLSSYQVADPQYATVIGLARVLRNELDVDFAVCQTATDFGSEKVVRVFEHFLSRGLDGGALTEKDTTPEMEYAIYDGVVNVGRYYPFKLSDAQHVIERSDRAVLTTRHLGHLGDLVWQSCNVKSPQDDEVEIEVHAAGLNDRDVAEALGTKHQLNKPTFGFEAAGVVRRIGTRVSNVQVGDRVAVLGAGCQSTITQQSERLVTSIPPTLSFTDAASMPVAFVTALHALFDLARLESGQSVLIHGVSSSVGMAALQIADMAGTEIFVTVQADDDDVPEGLENLLNASRLPSSRIYKAEDSSFTTEILRETNGLGVNVIIAAAEGALSGEIGQTAWECLDECGTIVVVTSHGDGARSHYKSSDRSGRALLTVDIGRLCNGRPAVMSRHLQTMVKLYREGWIAPIRPIKVFPASQIRQAFECVQCHTRNGNVKVVVDMKPEAIRTATDSGKAEAAATPQAMTIVARKQDVSFNSRGSYILAGGFGGLGRQVAVWLAEHGAGNIVFFSRSAGTTSSHQELVNELESMGVIVQAVKGDVTSLDDVSRAVHSATYPVKGVFQMSMVLRDCSWSSMTYNDWAAAIEPKVRGTWNLHRATREAGAQARLDFFVMFSSIATVVGVPGQSNYAAANAFLDAFSQYRLGLGLPASTVNVGVVEDVGVIARDSTLLGNVKAMGFLTVQGSDVVDALSIAVRKASTRDDVIGAERKDQAASDLCAFAIGVGSSVPLSSPGNRAPWRMDPRLAIYRNSSGGMDESTSSKDSGLKALLASARTDPAVLASPEAAALLAREIGSKVLTLLGKSAASLTTTQSLSDLGMDSLIGIEVRKWWKATFKFDISLLEMLGMGTLEILGKYAADQLNRSLHPDEVQ